MKSLVLTVVVLSALFQFIAAFLAIRLIRVSGALVAWVFLAAGFLVMGMRRAVTISHIWHGLSRGDLTAELLALLISLLVLCGISMIGPLFARIKLAQSELSKIHRELVDSEMRYRTVADFTSDWEFWLAPDNTFRYVSPSCEQVSGYSAQEFYRNPQLLLKIIHPDDVPRYLNHTHDFQENGQPQPIDFRITTRDGQQRWISHVCRSVIGKDGERLGQRASNRDVTERKRAEAELRESEQRFRELNETLEKRIVERKQAELVLLRREADLRRAQEIAKLGSWKYDMADPIWWSDELYRIYGVAPETFTPTVASFLNLIHPEDRPAMQAWIQACSADARPGELVFRIIWPDGTVRFISGRGELIRDVVVGLHMAGTAQDITERKQAEAALAGKQRLLEELNLGLERRIADAVSESREKDRILMQQGRQAAMGEMIGNIAHQWRQPLNTLGLIVQELLMTYGREEFNRESLQANVKKAMGLISHMSKTIEDFRNYFRPDKEKILFNVRQAVDKALSLVEPSLKGMEITIEVAGNDDAEING